MPESENITVGGVDYLLKYLAAKVVEKDSKLAVTSGAVWKAIQEAVSTIDSIYLKKIIPNSGYITVGGVRYNTIESVLEALATNGTDTPSLGSTKFFTAGGAFSDKSGIPIQNSTKCFTAGGAYADKAYAPEEGSTKCFTAGGAYDDKADAPAAGDTRNLTSGAAFNDKTDVANNSDKNFTSAGFYNYCGGSTSHYSWLGKVYGPMLGRKWFDLGSLSDVNVNDVYCDTFSGFWVLAGGNGKGLWWRSGLGSWTKGTGFGEGSTIQKVRHGGNIWVAGAWSVGLLYSTDGKEWTRTPTQAAQTLRIDALAYADGLWIAGSQNNGLWWSEDGINWTQCTGGETSSFTSIVHGGSKWMAGSTDHGLYTSSDGKNWSAFTSSAVGQEGVNITALCYGKGVWDCAFTTASVAYIYYSEDNGSSWVRGFQSNTDSAPVIEDIHYGNGKWVAAYSYSTAGQRILMAISSDGKAFTTKIINYATKVCRVFYANGVWIAGTRVYSGSGEAYLILSPDNGDTWYSVGVLASDIKVLYYAGGAWVYSTNTTGLRQSAVNNLDFNDEDLF